MDLDKLVPMTGDIILNDPSLESNSTFNIDKLNRAMRQIAIESYGNLYNVQKCKVGRFPNSFWRLDFQVNRRRSDIRNSTSITSNTP